MSAPRPTRNTTAEGTADARISFSATERRMRDDTMIGLYHPRRAIAGRWWNLRFPQRAKLAEPPSAYARTPARAGLWPAWQTFWNLRFPQRAKLAEPPSAYARTPARPGLWPASPTLRTDASAG